MALIPKLLSPIPPKWIQRAHAWTDRLLPASVSETGGDLLRRSRLLVWLALIGACACVFVASNALVYGLPFITALVLVGVVTFLAGPAVLASTGRLAPAVHVLMVGSVAYVLGANLLTGLTLVYSIYALGILPVAALIVAGPRVALPWLVVIVTLIAGLLLTVPDGFPQLISTDSSSWISLALSGALVVTISVYLLAAAHESLRAAAQAEADTARQGAEQAARAKGDFLAHMSHELRTPMHAVIGMSELLLDSELDEHQREYASIVRDSATSLLVILNDLLDLSKLDAGRITLEELPFDLGRECDLVMRLLSPQATSKGLRLELNVNSPPLALLGDPTRLRQILVNLIGNAVKFTEQGSVTVTAEVQATEAGRMQVELSVEDTGIGIPSDRRHEIFQPFAQLDQSTPRRFGGTGLGLSITQRLVALLGGTITVESEEGKGTRFQVRLLMRAAERQAPAPHVARIAEGKGVRVLVADDTAASLLLASRLLERRGFDVVTVTDGEQAVRAFDGGGFDLVLLDCHMPVLDGVEAARAIRRTHAGRHTPIVALSASAQAGDRDRCLSAGMSAFLAKPFRPGQLDELLDQVLRRDSAA